MNGRRARERRRLDARTLAFLPSPTADAAPNVRLGLRLRNEASLTGRCACGAAGEMVVLAPGLYSIRFEHEDDCPAISPALQRALERGEIHDPGGDLLRSLLDRGAAA